MRKLIPLEIDPPQLKATFRLRIRAGLMLSIITACLAGCAVSTPYPRLNTENSDNIADRAADPVVLVLTRIVVNSNARSEFDRQTARVIGSMASHPGLIGYSARRQLFGDEAWTMSVWASNEARAQFVRSQVHKEAMEISKEAIVTVESKRLTVARKNLPGNWVRALEMLADPADLRTYGN